MHACRVARDRDGIRYPQMLSEQMNDSGAEPD